MADTGNIFVVAELGTGHNGDINRAKELVCAAKEAGADCVKTQIVIAGEILHPASGEVPLPQGKIRLFEAFKRLEVPPDFYFELKEFAESRKILFAASPFGARSAEILFRLKPAFVKIASPELNYVQLLRKTAAAGFPVALSCGVSKLADIEAALACFKSYPPERICLLHCVTAYPAPEEDYNLLLIRNLKNIFGVPAGVSDHSLDPLLVPLLSLAAGASMIEKHFCLSRAGGGLDDPVALPPEDFALMCRELRRAQGMGSAAVMDYVRQEYGEEKVKAVPGDGVKRLAPAESGNYGRTNRSVHALTGIKAGEIFTEENLAVLRTEKVLRPGLPPCFYEKILGRPARRNISAGEGVEWEDI